MTEVRLTCHCGQADARGSKHCLLCRCDEHTAESHGKSTTQRPGCGPACTIIKEAQ